jgi:hypothetical protein
MPGKQAKKQEKAQLAHTSMVGYVSENSLPIAIGMMAICLVDISFFCGS